MEQCDNCTPVVIHFRKNGLWNVEKAINDLEVIRQVSKCNKKFICLPLIRAKAEQEEQIRAEEDKELGR